MLWVVGSYRTIRQLTVLKRWLSIWTFWSTGAYAGLGRGGFEIELWDLFGCNIKKRNTKMESQ